MLELDYCAECGFWNGQEAINERFAQVWLEGRFSCLHHRRSRSPVGHFIDYISLKPLKFYGYSELRACRCSVCLCVAFSFQANDNRNYFVPAPFRRRPPKVIWNRKTVIKNGKHSSRQVYSLEMNGRCLEGFHGWQKTFAIPPQRTQKLTVVWEIEINMKGQSNNLILIPFQTSRMIHPHQWMEGSLRTGTP